MCSAMAALMISEIGWLSTEATVSSCSAWSAEKRIVITLAGFMFLIMTRETLVVNRRGVMVS